MPSDRHGQAYWPGVVSVAACTYTCSHGIGPGTAVLTILPQAQLPLAYGNLTITDNYGTLTLTDCRVDKLRSQQGGDGEALTLEIYDRRWKWLDFGEISGFYNQTDAKGNLLAYTQRDLNTLASYCLNAMGESNYELQLPPNTYPPVNWEYANPAAELQNLAEQFGCRVVFHPGRNAVLVVPLGYGLDLPDGSLASQSTSLDSPDKPSAIVLVGEPVRYQARFTLEAVGEDTDGTIKVLDSLSYKPYGNWANCFPPYFTDPVFASSTINTDLESKEAAKKSVYKWYRIVGPVILPEAGQLASLEQLLLEDRQVTQVIGQDGYEEPAPPVVYGSYYKGNLGPASNTTSTQKVKVAFTIDREKRLVMFQDYVYYMQSQGSGEYTVLPGQSMTLETACQVRDAATYHIVRYREWMAVPDAIVATPPVVIRRPDVKYSVVGTYTSGVLTGFTTNRADATARAAYYLQAELAKYQLIGARERTYNGIMAVFPDGKIQQVTWTVGPSGAETTASLNTEHSLVVPPWPERRRIQYLRPKKIELVEVVKQSNPNRITPE